MMISYIKSKAVTICKMQNYIFHFNYLLFLAFFFFMSFYMGPAVAQYDEGQELIQPMELKQSFDPDAKSYAALSKSIYWARKAYMEAFVGNQAVLQADHKEAIKYLSEAIQLDPRSSFLYAKLAEESVNLQDYETARSAADTAVELGPSSADAHYWSGYLKYAKGQDKKGALAEFKKAAELEPEHLKAQLYLASIAFEAGDYKQASSAYSQVVKLRPYDPDLRYRLGVTYSELGDINKAIEEFRATTMLNEDHLEAHFRLANLYARQSQNKEAVSECVVVLKRVPNDPNIMLLLAQLYIAIGEYDKAISISESLIKGRSGSKKIVAAEAYYRMGTAYKEKIEKNRADENFQKSIDTYKALLEEDKQNIGLNYDIAMVYDARGDYGLAEQHLGRLIALKPDEPDAYNYLGYILVEQNKQLELAVSYIQKAITMEPNNGAFRDSLGWAYFKLNKLDEAIVELEKAAELTPDDSDIREHLGEAYLKRGGEFTQKAVHEWEKSLVLKPGKRALKQKLNDLQAKLNINTGK